MPGQLLEARVDSTVPALFGSVPGYSIWGGNPLDPAAANSFVQVTDASSFGGVLSTGFTDMVHQVTMSYNIFKLGGFLLDGSGHSSYFTDVPGGFGDVTRPPGVVSQNVPSLNIPLSGFIPTCNGDAESIREDTLSTVDPRVGFGISLGNECQSKIGWVYSTAPGTVHVTGLGFQPVAVLLFGCVSAIYGTLGGEGSYFMYGAFDGTTQWVSMAAAILGSGTRDRQFRNDRCIEMIAQSPTLGPNTPYISASAVSLDVDGFTLNYAAAGPDSNGNPSVTYWLAIRPNTGHGHVKVGIMSQGDASITTGWKPDAMWFCGAQTADHVLHGDAANAFVGASDGTNHRASWFGGLNGANVPQCFCRYQRDAAILEADPTTPSVVAKGIPTFTSTGATFSWPTDNGAGYYIGWVAFQNDTFPFMPPVVNTLSATGITRTTATLNGSWIPNTQPGDNVSYQFQWGPTTAYGNTTTLTLDGSGTSLQTGSANLTGLTPFTTYHYRTVVIEQVGGTTCTYYGPDVSFTVRDAMIFRNRFKADEPAPHVPYPPMFPGFAAGTDTNRYQNLDLISWTMSWNGGPFGAGSFTYADFSSTAGLFLGGTNSNPANKLRLCSSTAASESGQANRLTANPILFGFDTTFVFNINGGGGSQTSTNGPGGDGFAFLFQPESPAVGGGPSSAQGFMDGPFWCFAVNLSDWPHTWNANDNEVDVWFGAGAAIPSANPVPDRLAQADLTPGGIIKNGSNHTCRIVYAPATMTVILDGVTVLSLPVDLGQLYKTYSGNNAFAPTGIANFANEFKIGP